MLRDSLSVETTIDAPAVVVWRLLTVERETWWPDMRFEAVVGSPLVETWIENGRRSSATGVVTHSDGPHLLGFRWTEPAWDQPLDVMIRIVPQGEVTTVTLTEAGFVRARTPLSLPAEHEEGWTYHLGRLKRAAEDAGGVDP